MTAPACWSWPVPTVTRDQEIARLCARNATLPADERVSDAANVAVTSDWAAYRLDLFQGERCGICGSGQPGRLVQDHDHRTGLVRGWLCRSCNAYEAKNPAAGGAWAGYRQRSPAVIVGLRRYYVGFAWLDGWWENLDRARALTGDPNWQPIEGAATWQRLHPSRRRATPPRVRR